MSHLSFSRWPFYPSSWLAIFSPWHLFHTIHKGLMSSLGKMLSFSRVLGEGNTEHPVTLSPLRVTPCVFIRVNQEKTCLWQCELLRNVHCRDRPQGSAPIICCPLQSQENSQPSQPSHTGSVNPIHSPPARAQTVCTLYTQPPLPLVWPSVRWPVWEKDVLLLDQGKLPTLAGLWIIPPIPLSGLSTE